MEARSEKEAVVKSTGEWAMGPYDGGGGVVMRGRRKGGDGEEVKVLFLYKESGE